MIEQAVFYFLSAMVLVPALLVVTLRNVFHAGLFLALCMTGLGGLFALLGADFLFAVQILLYAGGVTVLLIFVVLLAGGPQEWAAQQVNGQWLAAILLSALFVAFLTALVKRLPMGAGPWLAEPTTARLGLLLLRDLVLPFEAVSLVLLAALVGAVHFSRKENS